MADVLNDELRDPRSAGFRRRRALSTVGTFNVFILAAVTTGTGFLVVPGSAHFGVGAAVFLTQITIATISGAVSFPLAGRLTARFGPRIMVITGSLLAAACLAGMAFAPNIEVFYLLSVPLGCAASFCIHVPAQTLVVGWHNHGRRGTVLGLVATGAAVGGVGAGFLYPPIIAAGGFYGGMLTMAAGFLLFGTLPGLFLISNPPTTETVPQAATDKAGRPSRAAVGVSVGVGVGVGVLTVLGMISALMFGLETPFFTIMPAVFAADGISPAAAGMLLAVYSIAGAVMKPVLGYLQDRIGMTRTLCIMVLVYAVGLPGMALFSGNGVVPYALLLPIAALALSTPTIMIPLIATRIASPDRFPKTLGWLHSGNFVGIGVGAPLWGLSFDLTGRYNTALVLAGLAGVLGIVVALVAIRLAHRAATRQSAGLPAPAVP